MDKADAVKKAREYLNNITKFIDIDKALLFGSYQFGHQRDDSDIDIALFVSKPAEDYKVIIKKLFRARRDVDPRIEPHLFIYGLDKSGFAEQIEKTGENLQN